MSRDIIDQEIQQLCEKWPAILEDNTIIRKAQGRYRINGREVTVSLRMREATREEEECVSKTPSLDEAKAADGQVMDLSGDLIVRDGPLKQPFLDYVFDTGQKEYYSMAEPDKLENKSVDTPKPLAPDLKGGQLAVQDDRLEANSCLKINSHFWAPGLLRQWRLLGHPVMPIPSASCLRCHYRRHCRALGERGASIASVDLAVSLTTSLYL